MEAFAHGVVVRCAGRYAVMGDPLGGQGGAEGAGFVLVCSKREARRLRLSILAEILSVGRGTEPRLWFNGKPTIGEGLTQALQEMFSDRNCPKGRVRVTYCDLNGESWRADEWCYAYVRTGTRHGSPLDLRHPAANWGDVGAASVVGEDVAPEVEHARRRVHAARAAGVGVLVGVLVGVGVGMFSK